MHELSVAMRLVDVACEQLTQLPDGARVRTLHVRLGPLSGVVAEALRFSFPLAAAGSPIEGARLEIETAPVIAWCDHCQRDQVLTSVQSMACPACGTPTPRLQSGRELELRALEVEAE